MTISNTGTPKKQQMSLEGFFNSAKKKEISGKSADFQHIDAMNDNINPKKRLFAELDEGDNANNETNNLDNNVHGAGIESVENSVVNDGHEQTEAEIDEEILELATENNEVEDGQTLSASELRKIKREQEKNAKKLIKERQEEEKRELKRQKKMQEEENRRLKKEREEEEKRIKREKIEKERLLKRELKEKERLEKLKKREDEIKAREEKKRLEEEEKIKRREELERLKLEKKKAEEEKTKKEEEKIKKRSIMNFFKPKAVSSSSSSSSLASHEIDSVCASTKLNTIKTPEINQDTSEFSRYFLPFHIQPNTEMASFPVCAIETEKWDNFLSNKDTSKFEEKATEKKLNTNFERSIEVLKCLNSGSINEANRLFKNVPLKFIRFYENRKQPYFGTFSYNEKDIVETEIELKLNPCAKITIKGSDTEQAIINYEDDSEAEIDDNGEDEEGEGEDLNSDEDDDDEEENNEPNSSDIDDEFVEREDGTITNSNQRRIIGPLVAIVRHCHEDIPRGDEFGEYFQSLQWERIRHDIQFPIDPFKNYWKVEKGVTGEPDQAAATPAGKTDASTSNEFPGASTPKSTASTDASISTPTPTMAVKKKIITEPKDVTILRAFITENSTLSMNTLAELAVKTLTGSYSRAVIKNTVKEHAQREKQGWVLRDT